MNGARNEHFVVEQGQKIESSNTRQIEDWRSVRDDDQIRSAGRRDWRSSRNSVTP